MLRKILDYEFNIQGQPIDRSGQNNHGFATATVATSGPGDLRGVSFLSSASRIDIPYRTSWSHLNAVEIETRFRLNELVHRVNLIEVSLSLALFVRSDGIVTFTYYAPEDAGGDPGDDTGGGEGSGPGGGSGSFTALAPPLGSIDPFESLVANPPPPDPYIWQGVNTDTQFSPDGVHRTVPVGQYVTVRARHDGFGSMRIYIDGELAGVRSDVKYGVPPLVPPGSVSVGAWPHDDRYTLNGTFDFLRFWREDPEFPYRQFFCREMSAEADRCWHDLFRTLADGFADPEARAGVVRLMECAARMQAGFARAIARASEAERQELRGLSQAYLRLWCAGDIEGEAMASVMRRFVEFLHRLAPDVFAAILPDLLACFADPKVKALCGAADCIPDCDPRWLGFIRTVVHTLPSPICPPESGGHGGSRRPKPGGGYGRGRGERRDDKRDRGDYDEPKREQRDAY